VVVGAVQVEEVEDWGGVVSGVVEWWLWVCR